MPEFTTTTKTGIWESELINKRDLESSTWRQHVYTEYLEPPADLVACNALCAFDYADAKCDFVVVGQGKCYLGSWSVESNLIPASTPDADMHLKASKALIYSNITSDTRRLDTILDSFNNRIGTSVFTYKTNTFGPHHQDLVMLSPTGYTETACQSLCFGFRGAQTGLACHFYVYASERCYVGNLFTSTRFTSDKKLYDYSSNTVSKVDGWFNESKKGSLTT